MIKIDLSPNYTSKTRSLKNIKFVIIHYTGMQSEIESLERLKDPKHKVSCHYLVNRKGKIIQMVKDDKIAWHAGKSKWQNFKNVNKNSIGIELVNKGHEFGYQSFTNVQIKNLIYLCKKIKKKYKIKNEFFLGHSDVAPLRKSDPGEKFPWKKLSENNLGTWFVNKSIIIKNINNKEMRELFFKNLHKIGYRYFQIYKKSIKETLVIKSFQQRYFPQNISGKIDKKTFIISHLLAQYAK
jgi:N-acetylmuramoyl-L-alanine amidase